jgi:hypothetical protein
MREIVTGTPYILRGAELVIQNISARLSLDAKVCAYDMNQAVHMVTSDTLDDDRMRQHIQNRKKRSGNILLGAVMGGLIDGSHGDDSVLDGIIVGAAFGAICSSNSADPRAKIGLIFADGETLTLSVDKEEYAQLNTHMAKNQILPAALSQSKCERPLTLVEKNSVLCDRMLSSLLKKGMQAMLIAFICLFPSYISMLSEVLFLGSEFPDNGGLTFFTELINLQDHAFYEDYTRVVISVFLIYAFSLFLHYARASDYSAYLRDNESLVDS